MIPNARRTVALVSILVALALGGCQRSVGSGDPKSAPLAVGKPVAGEITLGDRVNYADGTRTALFDFEMAAGEAVLIEAAAAFCGRLSLYSLDAGGRPELQSTSDGDCVEEGGRQVQARSSISANGGRYLLALSGREPGHFGPYRVSLSALALDARQDVVAGDDVNGLLDETRTLTLKITEPGGYQIDLRSSEFDATLALEGAAVSIESDDDGEGSNARIKTFLAVGEYRLVLDRFGSAGTGGLYRLSVAKRDGAAPADLQNGGELPAGRDVTGMLQGEPVRYELMLAERSRVELSLRSEDFDTRLDLGGEGVRVSDDDGGDGTNSRLVTVLDPGRYTVTAVDLGGDNSGLFTVSARVVPATGVSLSLSPGGAQSGALAEGEQRRYRLSVPASATYVLTMTSSDLDSLLSIVRDEETLATDDDGGGGANARLELELEAGEYEVIAAAFGGGSGDFRIRAETR